MLDIGFIRENRELVEKAAKDKGAKVDIEALLGLDEQRRELITAAEEIRAERNQLIEEIKGRKPTAEQIERGKQYKDILAEKEDSLDIVQAAYFALLKLVPNVPSADTPVGSSEDENKVLKKVGEPAKFDFKVKDHMEIGEAKGWIEKDRARTISGARFAYLMGDLARMQFGLMQFGLDVLGDEKVLAHIAKEAGLDVSTKPFVPVLPPMMMRTKAYDATARLKPNDVTFKLDSDDLWLIGSAEHSLCAYYMNDVIEEELPVRFAGYSSSFRREVGSAGKDTTGILRMHHFDKLEMESFTDKESSRDEHEFMIAIQEYLMQQLGLPYQVVLKCTFDMGSPNARGVDIETWMPAQELYRETHSADYMQDYQARSLKTKYIDKDGQREYAHTNDATAFAAGRTLIAIVENNQTKDGDVRVPEVLQPFVGKEVI